MNDLFGLLIFAVIAVVGVISKLREQRVEAQQREERRARRVRPEDLPEKTRKLFEGTPAGERRPAEFDIPVARPRGADQPAPRRTPPVPMPSFGGGESHAPVPPRPQRRPPAPTRRPVPPMPQEARQQTRTTMQQMWEQAQGAQPQRRSAPAPRRSQAPAQRRRPPEQSQTPHADAAARDTALRKQAQQKAAHAKRPVVRKRKPVAARLLSTKKNVRYGVILKEILDQPRALRSYDGF